MTVPPTFLQHEARGPGEQAPTRWDAGYDGRAVWDQRLRTLVTMSADGLLVIGRDDGVVQFANPAAAQLLGQPLDRLVGQPFDTPLRPGEPCDIDIAPLAGEPRVIQLRTTAIDWDGAPCYLVNLRDVTEPRRLAAQLAEADRRKDEFLAMLAHELRNPLAPLRNALYMLRQRDGDTAAQEWAWEVVQRQMRHLGRMVDGLLDVSRVTRGRVRLQREPLDLAGLVRRVADAARPLFDARRHQCHLHLPDRPVTVEADALRLEQVLANLLDNAARYTDPAGRIDVTVRGEPGWAVVEVADTGVGLAPEVLPRVFNLFEQADRTLARSEGGLGIGLTLVKRLVELHGGTVEAHSAGPGHGSTFTVRLPATDAAPVAAPRPAAAPLARRVLVVDDNRDLAESLGLVLRLWGHDVRVAYDGRAALAAAQEHPPDVVFLDLGLPQMDGYEVARQMRRDPALRRARLVAVTGYGRDEDRQRTAEAGFDLHLTKPVDPLDLQPLLAEPLAAES